MSDKWKDLIKLDKISITEEEVLSSIEDLAALDPRAEFVEGKGYKMISIALLHLINKSYQPRGLNIHELSYRLKELEGNTIEVSEEMKSDVFGTINFFFYNPGPRPAA